MEVHRAGAAFCSIAFKRLGYINVNDGDDTMSLTRYEFKILRHLEREGKEIYDIWKLSDSLCIFGTTIMKSLDEMCDRGLIVKNLSGTCSV